ncbi:unnamed protein product [Soboliphyme baturini]|uniref:Ribosomal_S4 domain-containing protein n=1 Tax=Soboliphyme baturini TaxID=241478 RepID=A0A183J895_9BILA|nr:unnamed protein product [Soboliphyme baturini]
MRRLKFHEKKLLKKVDFIDWELDRNVHEVTAVKRYHLKDRTEYVFYKKLAREVRELAAKIKELDVKDAFRVEMSRRLIDKLYHLGVIATKGGLDLCASVTASSFCRRRLPVVLVKLHMAEHLKAATMFVEHGHVRVGPELITDPAYIVSRYVRYPASVWQF